MTQTPCQARSERGFSMFLVIMAMFITSMFVAAAFAGANGDLRISGTSQVRKVSYAAAEAGLNYYETQLNQDPDYWTHCENVDPPSATEPNPVNKVWDGKTPPADPRIWRNVTKSSAQYTIEVLPANGNSACVEGNQSTVLDQKTGTFRIRITGRPSATSTLHRSIIATFKRAGFLDYLWFTYFEDLDPAAMSTQTARTAANKYCAGLFRWERPAAGAPSGACTEIQWITGDGVAGPVHSNDSLLICNQPVFGRDDPNDDVVEVMPTNNPRVAASGCTDQTKVKGIWKTGAARIEPPTDDQDLEGIASNGGKLYTGRTIIHLDGDVMTVTEASGKRWTNIPLPDNGVIYVKTGTTTPACATQYPVDIDYNDQAACGNVYVSGTYSKSLTIAADNDIIIAPTAGGTLNTTTVTGESLRQVDGSDSVLGLIANRFVRVAHAEVKGTDSHGNATCDNAASNWDGADVRVDAAILALQHSWIVDNYSCGDPAGKLTVFGAIAQYYRGPVGTGGHATGFLKDYQYDNRLKYRSPPYFLSPLASQWLASRINEQVPAL